jgi:hypothetical protein
MSESTDLNDSEPARIPLRLHEPAAGELRTLRCIAEARDDSGTITYLTELDASPLNCEGVKVPF